VDVTSLLSSQSCVWPVHAVWELLSLVLWTEAEGEAPIPTRRGGGMHRLVLLCSG
jgi:hypothetical protein